jgi:hypothetical protein
MAVLALFTERGMSNGVAQGGAARRHRREYPLIGSVLLWFSPVWKSPREPERTVAATPIDATVPDVSGSVTGR